MESEAATVIGGNSKKVVMQESDNGSTLWKVPKPKAKKREATFDDDAAFSDLLNGAKEKPTSTSIDAVKKAEEKRPSAGNGQAASAQMVSPMKKKKKNDSPDLTTPEAFSSGLVAEVGRENVPSMSSIHEEDGELFYVDMLDGDVTIPHFYD